MLGYPVNLQGTNTLAYFLYDEDWDYFYDGTRSETKNKILIKKIIYSYI